MAGNEPHDRTDVDDLKGRAKKAVGALSGDEQLEREGTVDRVVSDVKEGVDLIAEKVKDLLRSNR